MSADSPHSSPSLLNTLRQYRFQKKPYSNTNNGLSSGSAATTSGYQSAHPPSLFSTSGPVFSTLPTAASSGYKRIKPANDSSSDSERDGAQIAKKPIIELTHELKSRRLKNLCEMFPDISPLMVRATLSKHNWNEERTRDELLDYDPEHESPAPTKPEPAPAFSYQNGTRPGTSNRIAHARAALQVRRPPGKGSSGMRRRKGSDTDDSDYGGRDKVFDSSDDSDSEVVNDLVGKKKPVFQFLNESKQNELIQLQGCSQKKAEAILSVRPFTDWLDLVGKLKGHKHLNTDLLNATQELLEMRENISKLMKKCGGLAAQLEQAVSLGAGITKQPSILDPNFQLASYQMVGLNWLSVLHKNKVNGILADEMGLGKTVQVIAFMAYLKETGQAHGAHVIVVPASTLENWNVEIARWCPSLRVSVYYGSQDERKVIRGHYHKNGLKNFDVILTTYTLVCSCPEEKKMFRVLPLHYVIFDEAHMLKNMATQRYENLFRIHASRRILLTGTPLQNNLIELMSLLKFVMPHLFDHITEDLKSLFAKNSKTSVKIKEMKEKGEKGEEEELPLFEQSQISQAKRIMKPFLLRRLKRDVLKDLPKKTDIVEYIPLSDRQQTLYKDLITSYSAKDGVVHATTEQSGMSMMMEMRKLANHPLLVRNYYDERKLQTLSQRLAQDSFYKENNPQYILDDLRWMSDFQIHQLTTTYKSICGMGVPDKLIADSGKFEKLDEMLPRLRSEGHRVLIFSQFVMMLDVLEPYLKLRGHKYLRLDGTTAVTTRQDLIDQYNMESGIFIFLLSTRAGGLGINLTAADTVIIHDMDFNPYNDKQAEDRCHRMGQTKPVTIYRIISSGTIEEGIYQVAQEKLNLERDITKTDENDQQETKNVVRLLNLAMGISNPTPMK